MYLPSKCRGISHPGAALSAAIGVRRSATWAVIHERAFSGHANMVALKFPR
jgi:hypothetical protein